MRGSLFQNATTILLQNATEVYYKCVRFIITICDSFITKCHSYYKMCWYTLLLGCVATLQY